jgi:hypothetical protein
MAGLLLAGCTSVQTVTAPSIGHYIDNQVTYVRGEISDAYLYSGVLEGYASKTVELRNPSSPTPVLMTTVDAMWQGTIDELTTAVAGEIGYTVSASGEKSGSPILISTNLYNLPALGLLREAYGQAKGRARLVIDQGRNHMTIHYARPERSPVPHKEDLEP